MDKQVKLYTFDQRSPEWYEIRKGKITASPILNILGSLGTAKCKDAIDNLAMTLAIESVHGISENEYLSFDMQRGVDMEPSAFRLFSEIMANDFIQVSQIGFAEISEHIGSSPDGLCSNNSTVEIKCPNEKNFFKLFLKGEIDPKHIAQMQHQMYCTNTIQAYYFAYCVCNNKEYHFIKQVQRDENMINLIEDRCELVIDLKNSYIERLLN